MSRRSVLKGVGIGAGALVIAGTAGVGIRGANNGVWNHGEGAVYALWQSWQDAPELQRVVAAGTLAANPHNIQPWSFVIGESSIDLFADPGRAMPAGDADGRERIAGYGCALENMVLAARSSGLEPHLMSWPSSDPDHIANLAFTAGAAPSEREKELVRMIAVRHSNRGPYATESVGSDLLDALTDLAPAGATVTWITDSAAMAAMGALIVEATQAIIDDDDMSIEAFSWFRSDRADIDRHGDGLTLDCQGLDGFTLFMAKILPAQSRAEGDAFWVKTARDVHTATARAYGVIRVSDDTDAADQLVGGRVLQHVHLAATAAGLGLQHMNQVTERIARDAALGRPDVFSERWAAATGVPAGQGLLAFRIGYPERTARPSPRRDLNHITRAQ